MKGVSLACLEIESKAEKQVLGLFLRGEWVPFLIKRLQYISPQPKFNLHFMTLCMDFLQNWEY